MKSLVISYFGCIDKKYTRNKTNIDGLRQAGAVVHEVILDTPVTPLNSANHTSNLLLIRRVFHKLRIIPVILRHLSELQKSDLIFVGYPGQFDMPLAWLTAKLLGKKLVFDPVILMFNALTNDIGVLHKTSLVTRLLYTWESWIMHAADLIIASSIEQKDFFIQQMQLPAQKVVIAYLAADNSYYYPAKKLPNDDTFRIIYYGLFTPLHGLPHILEAAQLCQKYPHILFQLIGKGQLYEQTRQQAEQLKLKNVEFYPDVAEPNALKYLQKANIFLGFLESNTTLQREIPNKVYQGLAMAKVVLTGNSAAIRSVLTNQKEIVLVPAANGQALADAIVSLWKKPKLAAEIAENGYQFYLKHFTPKAIGQVLVAAMVTLVT